MRHEWPEILTPVTVCGIPALAEVSNWQPGLPEVQRCYSHGGLPAEPPTYVLRLFDRRGYEAPWLEALADKRDLWDEIEEQL